jgi:hypothetical protein
MTEKPGFLGKALAFVQGEVPTDTLEAYRRAGNAVYDLLDKAEAQRLSLKIQGLNPWTAPTATQAHLLCTWNAFALQTLGDQFLDADYQFDPATVGYVPSKTARQIFEFYNQVENWLSHSHQALSNPNYCLSVHVPAELPPWVEVEPCPPSHLEGMMMAARSLRIHAEAAMSVFESEGLPDSQKAILHELHQLLAEANSKIAYAEELFGNQVSEALHERIEGYAKNSIELYYRLGQLLAMPKLVKRSTVRQPSNGPHAAQLTIGTNHSLSSLKQSGFDLWCITDPNTIEQWRQDPKALESLYEMWSHDPAPRKTLAIQMEINEAMRLGKVAHATDFLGRQLWPCGCCPWAPIYIARHPITIGGCSLQALHKFTYVVDATGVLQGKEFKRQILRLTGNFYPPNPLDYSNPDWHSQQ